MEHEIALLQDQLRLLVWGGTTIAGDALNMQTGLTHAGALQAIESVNPKVPLSLMHCEPPPDGGGLLHDLDFEPVVPQAVALQFPQLPQPPFIGQAAP